MSEPSSPLTRSSSGRTWDEAASPEAARLVRRFEADWRRWARQRGGPQPDPANYLPHGSEADSGAWLALLRAEFGLRHETREQPRVEQYLSRFPDLDSQIVLALLYEEFCLREEAGQRPDPEEFARRFPDHAGALRRVLEIHDLVGGSHDATIDLGSSTIAHSAGRTGASPPEAPFPDSGQSIGGFRLVEELGRGSFARVFLAQERLLADRPVALKVAKTGSREPQTLARLQHTHIVPVHSYRVDPATGLHLLCMPYFGRTTLANLLDDPEAPDCRTGADLLAILDRLEPPEPDHPRPLTAARKALLERSLVGAVAWWGARLAEALAHAHDRGVLHRDIKPSNVLLTADGLPMLLDFNLAHAPRLQDSEAEPAKLGGTLAYMAPEHLEALADNQDEGVDERADLFALGVVLHEVLAGNRPFPNLSRSRSIAEALLDAAERRRHGPPPLRRQGRPISPALEAVLRRCMAAAPEARYGHASELAEDLQAVADDKALPHASEPLPSRSIRWLRRNRLRFALAAPVVLALFVLAAVFHDSRMSRLHDRGRIARYLNAGLDAEHSDRHETALERYQTAESLASERPEFADLRRLAHEKVVLVRQTLELRRRAEELLERIERLRYRLLGFVNDGRPADALVPESLSSFYVYENPDWSERPELSLLDPETRTRVLNEIHEILFLDAVYLRLTRARLEDVRPTIALLADRARGVLGSRDPRRGPWRALLAELGARETEEAAAASPDAVHVAPPARDEPIGSGAEADAAFLWGVYHAARLQWTNDPRDADRAAAWLQAACRGRPDHTWARFYLATFAIEQGDPELALRHADVAVALRPDSAWARFNRSEVHRRLRHWEAALRDLEDARALVPEDDRDRLADRIAINLGLVHQRLGHVEEARRLYRSVVGASAVRSSISRMLNQTSLAFQAARFGSASRWVSKAALRGTAGRPDRDPLSWGARLNLARLETEAGRWGPALATYNRLLVWNPDSREARLGRAILRLALGDEAGALADAERLLETEPKDTDALVLKTKAALALKRRREAVAAARAAARRSPRPSHQRLKLRALLADGRIDAVRLDDPADLDLLPVVGPSLASELWDAARTLELLRGDHSARLTRAVLLAVLGDESAALEAAAAPIEDDPAAVRPRLTRARILIRFGRFEDARDDVEAALEVDPDHPEALGLSGRIALEEGRPPDALVQLRRAKALGDPSPLLPIWIARVQAASGDHRGAIETLAEALDRDPDDPRLWLVLGQFQRHAGDPSAARSAFDRALSAAADRPELRWIARAQLGAFLVGSDRKPLDVMVSRLLDVFDPDRRPRQPVGQGIARPDLGHPPEDDAQQRVRDQGGDDGI